MTTTDPCRYTDTCPNQASEYVSYPSTVCGLTYDGVFHPATQYSRVCTPCADGIPGLESRRPLTLTLTGEGVLAAIIANPEPLPERAETATDRDQDCRCGQWHAPELWPLLDWFDEIYGDKAHRHHDRLIDLVNDQFGNVAAKLDQLEREHKARGLLPAALAYLGSAQVVRDHVDIV